MAAGMSERSRVFERVVSTNAVWRRIGAKSCGVAMVDATNLALMNARSMFMVCGRRSALARRTVSCRA